MPWRLAVYFWETADNRVLPVMRAQVGFFERQKQVSAGYRLDGSGLVDYVNICFLAPVGALFRVSVAPHTQNNMSCHFLPRLGCWMCGWTQGLEQHRQLVLARGDTVRNGALSRCPWDRKFVQRICKQWLMVV